MSGRNTALKYRCGVATTLATASGEEMAQFFGTSSPTTIRNTVESAVPITRPTDEAAPAERPADSMGPRSSFPIEGSASMPITRFVTVMPS